MNKMNIDEKILEFKFIKLMILLYFIDISCKYLVMWYIKVNSVICLGMFYYFGKMEGGCSKEELYSVC